MCCERFLCAVVEFKASLLFTRYMFCTWRSFTFPYAQAVFGRPADTLKHATVTATLTTDVMRHEAKGDEESQPICAEQELADERTSHEQPVYTISRKTLPAAVQSVVGYAVFGIEKCMISQKNPTQFSISLHFLGRPTSSSRSAVAQPVQLHRVPQNAVFVIALFPPQTSFAFPRLPPSG